MTCMQNSISTSPRILNGALVGAGSRTTPDGGILPLAGGTNMIVDLRARTVAPAALVSIARVPGIRGIEIADGRVRMGGRTTVSDMLRHDSLGGVAPSLVASAKVFAGQMVRNTATVAGNICSGSPAADLVPPLLVLDADVTLTSGEGSRSVALADFYHGYKQMERRLRGAADGGQASPCRRTNAANLFYKLARRKGDAITVVGVAVGHVRRGRRRAAESRIALGSVAPFVTRASRGRGDAGRGDRLRRNASRRLRGRPWKSVSPIDDVRASAGYRSHCVHVVDQAAADDGLGAG